jgi:hypothetical protein
MGHGASTVEAIQGRQIAVIKNAVLRSGQGRSRARNGGKTTDPISYLPDLTGRRGHGVPRR